jgi:hypothetical protein
MTLDIVDSPLTRTVVVQQTCRSSYFFCSYFTHEPSDIAPVHLRQHHWSVMQRDSVQVGEVVGAWTIAQILREYSSTPVSPPGGKFHSLWSCIGSHRYQSFLHGHYPLSTMPGHNCIFAYWDSKGLAYIHGHSIVFMMYITVFYELSDPTYDRSAWQTCTKVSSMLWRRASISIKSGTGPPSPLPESVLRGVSRAPVSKSPFANSPRCAST